MSEVVWANFLCLPSSDLLSWMTRLLVPSARAMKTCLVNTRVGDYISLILYHQALMPEFPREGVIATSCLNTHTHNLAVQHPSGKCNPDMHALKTYLRAHEQREYGRWVDERQMLCERLTGFDSIPGCCNLFLQGMQEIGKQSCHCW